MARSKISKEEWEKAKEYFEHGLSLSEIHRKTGISKGAIGKKSNSEKWDRDSPKRQTLSQAIEVTKAKETMKETPIALEVHEELHNEMVRITARINRIQEKALSKAETMLDQIDTPSDLKTIIEAVDKAAITLKVADRHAPKIDITQQMAVQSTAPTAVHYIEDVQTRD